jgi:hypothetical protein
MSVHTYIYIIILYIRYIIIYIYILNPSLQGLHSNLLGLINMVIVILLKLNPYGLMTIYGLMGTYLEHPT